MDKEVVKRLRVIENQLPTIFEWIMLPTPFLGEDLNLTPLSKNGKFKKGEWYNVPMPHLRAVTHKQQLKDAFKKGGAKSVREYCKSVTDKYKQIILSK